VKKEFFQLLVTELLCPDYGMLIYQPESRTYWFNPTTLEADAEFLLLGLGRRRLGRQLGRVAEAVADVDMAAISLQLLPPCTGGWDDW